MKKVLIIIVSVIVLVIAALFVIPVVFKGDILRLIEKQSAKYIRSELVIGDVSLSMFKNFPNLSVDIRDVTISDEKSGEKDTLAHISLFQASLNLGSLISGDEIVINYILLKDALLAPKIAADGQANWDIMIESEVDTGTETTKEATTSDDKTDRPIRFNDIRLQGITLNYVDIQGNMQASISPLNMALSGNFSEANTVLHLALELKNIVLRQNNSTLLQNINLAWNTDISANLKDDIYTLEKSALTLNDLKLDLSGKVGIQEEKYDLDLNLKTPDTQFENILALLPPAILNELKGVKTSGEFELGMTVKGEYYENHYPAIDLQFDVRKGYLKYPDLPESIDNINVQLGVKHPGGPLSLMAIDLTTLSFHLAGNPFNMNLHLTNPEDPVFKGGVDGTINFESLKKALPLDDMTLNGILTAHLDLNGKYEYIEKEQYDKFTANGKISCKDVLFTGSDFPNGISIPTGDIIITPTRLDMKNLHIGINSSDMQLEGYVSNYLPWLFRDQLLKGSFEFNSKNLNLNELMNMSSSDTTMTSTEETPLEVIELPRNMDISLQANIQNLLFDSLIVKNINGNIRLHEARATLKNLGLELLKGKIMMNGSYNTVDVKKPGVDFNIRAENIDLGETINSFSIIRESLPAATNCSGVISTAMKFEAQLDQEMSPIMNTVNGGGNFTTNNILIKDNPTLIKLAGILKNDELNRISISNLSVDFILEQGNITIKPCTFPLAGNPTTFSGTQTVDGKLDYTLSMNIKKEDFGKEINNVLASIPGSDKVENIDVDVKLGGTLDEPTISPDFSKALKSIGKSAGEELKGNLIKGLDKLLKKEKEQEKEEE